MAIAQRASMRFVAFLVVMALVFAYIAWKWQEFNRQTVSDQGGAPLVVVGGGEPAAGEAPEQAAADEEAVPASGGDLGAGAQAQPGAYFAQGRYERDRARSQRVEILKGMIDNPNVSAETRRQAEQELLVLSRRAGQEVEIENLLQARGFGQVLVYLYEGSAVVVVDAESLTEAQAAQIADTVARVAGVPYEAISILARPD